MSDFRDLQQIYENAWRIGPNQGRFFSGNQSDVSLSQIPGGLPTQSPGGVMNVYSSQQSSSSNPIRFEYEEGHVDKKVSKLEIIKKIEELKSDSNNDGMLYAVHQLGVLEEFIKNL